MILFSQEPYTTKLMANTLPSLLFTQKAIWLKNHFANALVCKRALVSVYEEILIFKHCNSAMFYKINKKHPLRDYSRKVNNFIGLRCKEINDKLKHGKAQHFLLYESLQFSLCTESTYNELIKVFKINKMQDFKTYTKLKEIALEFLESTNISPHTFNLNNKKVKKNVFNYKKDYTGLHPTQKPVALLEDLITTYSNKNETILDLTMGSGSTGIACLNTDRDFIGIEKEERYFKVALNRIKEHENQVKKERFKI